MSTAGKVLVVLVMLAAVACLFMAGGIAQLNANANKRLQELSTQLAKAQEDISAAKREAMALRDETSETQERIDREIAALRSQQTDLERTKTQITDTLARLQYDLGTVSVTLEKARTSIKTGTDEFEADEKELAQLRVRVQSLKENNSQLMGRLHSLRQQFQETHRKNAGVLGKAK